MKDTSALLIVLQRLRTRSTSERTRAALYEAERRIKEHAGSCFCGRYDPCGAADCAHMSGAALAALGKKVTP